ncbi:MAG: hypothetical protein HY554_05740 [Elusimicrobia bacterium]|nr:hypothetical protein [Elusimicrobiota bacterium]
MIYSETLKRLTASTLAGALLGGSGPRAWAAPGQAGSPSFAAAAKAKPPTSPESARSTRLRGVDDAELRELYGASLPGPIPQGVSGRYGASALDGKPSILLEGEREGGEMRMVEPGLYLGFGRGGQRFSLDLGAALDGDAPAAGRPPLDTGVANAAGAGFARRMRPIADGEPGALEQLYTGAAPRAGAPSDAVTGAPAQAFAPPASGPPAVPKEKVPAALGKRLVGEFQGRDAAWRAIVELWRQGVQYLVVADRPEDSYGVAAGNRLAKGLANELGKNGFKPVDPAASVPHGALALFVGEREPVRLYIDEIGPVRVAKVVRHGAAYPGALSPYDALMRGRAAERARLGKASPELIRAATPRHGISVPRRLLMRALAKAWKLADDAVDSKWDDLPAWLRPLYLYANMQSLRLRFWDANKDAPEGPEDAAASDAYDLLYRSGDGSRFDPGRPDVGRSYVSSFTRIAKPDGPPVPHDEASLRRAAELAALEARKRDPATGEPRTIDAGILNVHAASWIQFNVHDWMNHSRRALEDKPFLVPLPADHPLRAQGLTHMTLERTAEGKTVEGIPVFQNELSPGWDLSNTYGATDELQATLRVFQGGRLKVGEDKRLLDDPRNPGLPLTGFNDNISAPLAFLHTLWTLEHNAIADALHAEHPDWSDERLFQIARLRLSALTARIHTTEWTRALLPQDALQVGMWVDWYGLLGKDFKDKVMRWSNEHPTLARFVGPLVRNEVLFGAPGTRTEAFGVNHAMPEEFVDVYRLHTMIRDTYTMERLTTNDAGEVEVEVTAELPFGKMHGYQTQALSRDVPLEDQALSWGRQSAGALTLHNMPDELRRFHTQDDRYKDMAAVHNVRAAERGHKPTYVNFTMKLGERPPRTFLELTGGDPVAADELERAFGKVEDVTFRAGILAERKPKDFALGNRQFKVFVLMAPRRLKSDRFLSQMYDAEYYGGQSGINYVENTKFSDLVLRHFPGMRPAFEGIDNAFKPLPKPGTLAERALEAAARTSESLGPGDSAAARRRAKALEAMSGVLAELKAGKSEGLARRVWEAEDLGKAAGGSTKFREELRNVRIVLLDRIRERQPKIDPASLPGETAIQKKYWGLLFDGDGERRVDENGRPKLAASWSDTYDFLRRSGESRPAAFVTATLSHWSFASKTQRKMTDAEKAAVRPGRFDIYVPNLVDAQQHSNTRVYASRETAAAKGLAPGDIDREEVERAFREAGLKEVLTARDVRLMIESNRLRDKREGRGCPFARWLGERSAKRRAEQLFDLFADRVVWEEEKHGKLVPGISRERFLEVYSGAAQAQILLERGHKLPPRGDGKAGR